MAPRKTKFNPKWLDKKDKNDCTVSEWCSAVAEDEYSAYCKVCRSTFLVDNQGFSQVLGHSNGSKHQKMIRNMKNQVVFFASPAASTSKELILSSNSKCSAPISLQDKVLKAEIFILLSAIKNNYSFSSLTDWSQMLSEIFDDSEIAKGIKMSDKKARYMMNFGLAPYFKSLIFKDISESFYVLHFDETTTKQVKKQLDIYLSYWSETRGKVVHCYCESYFLGHAGADKLLELLKDFLEKQELSMKKLLQLSMDGPNVNLSLQQKINNELDGNSLPAFIDIGTCSLHVMHNALRKGLNKLSFNVDKFAADVHQWFRLSAVRKEDFHRLQIEELDETLANHVFLRHISTRWLTLGPVCDRLIEQYSVLETYFLKEIAAQYDGSMQERYARIANFLNDKMTLVHLHFISFLASLFRPYMLLLQKETPVIHILYEKLNEFVRSVFLKFVKLRVVEDKKGIHLVNVDPNKGENWLESKRVDIGTAAKNALNALEVQDKSFILSVRSCYITIVDYLVKNLPIANPLLSDIRCLCPFNRKKISAKGQAYRLLSYLPQLCTQVSVPDKLNEEWLLYMCDDENLLELTNTYSTNHDICSFWNEVSKIKDCTGNVKYPNLSSVAKSCLILSPANAIPERGFSVNNRVVTKERSSLSDLTIRSTRICKDAIRLHHYEIKSIHITKGLLDSVRKSHAEYSSYMEEQQKKKEEQQRKRKADEEVLATANEEKAKRIKLEEKVIELQKQEKNLIEDQKVAQSLLNEASMKLNSAIEKDNRNEIKTAQMMINAANSEIAHANAKLMECCNEQDKLKRKLKLKF